MIDSVDGYGKSNIEEWEDIVGDTEGVNLLESEERGGLSKKARDWISDINESEDLFEPNKEKEVVDYITARLDRNSIEYYEEYNVIEQEPESSKPGPRCDIYIPHKRLAVEVKLGGSISGFCAGIGQCKIYEELGDRVESTSIIYRYTIDYDDQIEGVLSVLSSIGSGVKKVEGDGKIMLIEASSPGVIISDIVDIM